MANNNNINTNTNNTDIFELFAYSNFFNSSDVVTFEDIKNAEQGTVFSADSQGQYALQENELEVVGCIGGAYSLVRETVHTCSEGQYGDVDLDSEESVQYDYLVDLRTGHVQNVSYED